MTGGEAHAPAGAEDQHLAVPAHEQVRDQRAEQVAGARGDNDADEGELGLRGQRAAKRHDDFARDRNPRTFRGHRQEDGDEPTRGDELDDLM